MIRGGGDDDDDDDDGWASVCEVAVVDTRAELVSGGGSASGLA